MEKPNFDEAIKDIAGRDRRYKPDGYQFLRDALDHTVSSLRQDELIEHRHVSGPELIDGVIKHALKEYGPMSVAVLDSWGIRTGEDIGAMVFNLIEVGAFGRSDEDSLSDFSGVVELQDELLVPFRPSRKVLKEQENKGGDEPPARGNQPAKSNEI
tara:strand:- start:465 stop:932 length:468 start_codon:yes stop_codon:yes gene_type:complete